MEESSKLDKKFNMYFEEANLYYKNVLLNLVIASAKCMYIEVSNIIESSPEGQLQFLKSGSAERDRNVIKKRQK